MSWSSVSVGCMTLLCVGAVLTNALECSTSTKPGSSTCQCNTFLDQHVGYFRQRELACLSFPYSFQKCPGFTDERSSLCKCKVCGAGEREVWPCTRYVDTLCALCTACTAGKYVSTSCSGAKDTRCSTCGYGKFRAEKAHYETECIPHTRCSWNEQVEFSGSKTEDKRCVTTTSTTTPATTVTRAETPTTSPPPRRLLQQPH